MIIVSGKLYVDPAERAAYLDGCRSVIQQARAAPGCLDFTLSADPLEPGRINVYEVWESDEDVARFRGSGPSAAQEARITDASVARYRVASVEAP